MRVIGNRLTFNQHHQNLKALLTNLKAAQKTINNNKQQQEKYLEMHALDQTTVAAISARRFVHFASQMLHLPTLLNVDKDRIEAVLPRHM